MNRSRKILVIFSSALIILVAAAGFFVISFIFGPFSTGTQYLQQCSPPSSPQQPGPNITQLETLSALVINPNSIAKICVAYQSSTNTSVNAILNSSVYYANNMTLVPSNLIHIMVQPNTITAPVIRGQSPEPFAYAVFSLIVSDNAKGFYMLYLAGVCPLMPLAVGYYQINYSEFAYGWHHQNQCAPGDVFGSFVSSKNVNYADTYIPLNSQ